mmetsp:Transcript_1588/g.1997  ORF Transcript_1588/g.1997 Transcript_1588/m.1997 type:complete len:92 (-) Transcript_1588:40-315(-)
MSIIHYGLCGQHSQGVIKLSLSCLNVDTHNFTTTATMTRRTATVNITTLLLQLKLYKQQNDVNKSLSLARVCRESFGGVKRQWILMNIEST